MFVSEVWSSRKVPPRVFYKNFFLIELVIIIWLLFLFQYHLLSTCWWMRGKGRVLWYWIKRFKIQLSRLLGSTFSFTCFFSFHILYYDILPYGVKCIHDMIVEFVRNSILYNMVLCYILNVVFLLLHVFYESLWTIFVISYGILEPSLVTYLACSIFSYYLV